MNHRLLGSCSGKRQYNLFWKRFNTMGATFSIYGLIMAALLVTLSPVVSRCR